MYADLDLELTAYLALLVAFWATSYFAVIFLNRPRASWWRCLAVALIFVGAIMTIPALPSVGSWQFKVGGFLLGLALSWAILRLKRYHNLIVALGYLCVLWAYDFMIQYIAASLQLF
jgi:hypothetical protein